MLILHILVCHFMNINFTLKLFLQNKVTTPMCLWNLFILIRHKIIRHLVGFFQETHFANASPPKITLTPFRAVLMQNCTWFDRWNSLNYIAIPACYLIPCILQLQFVFLFPLDSNFIWSVRQWKASNRSTHKSLQLKVLFGHLSPFKQFILFKLSMPDIQ